MLRYFSYLIFLCISVSTVYAQDEIVLKKTGKPLDFDLKILEVKNDSIYYLAFRKEKKLPLKEVNSYYRAENNLRVNLTTPKPDSSWVFPNSKTGLNSKENIQKKQASLQKNIPEYENRNVVALGYQIGGFSLIGFEYEIRFHDYFGINLGAGFRGFTGGLKVHTKTLKSSPFFLLSYKDGGFGLINTFGVEYGGRWVFKPLSDFGLHYQIGLAKILEIDRKFEKYLFQGNTTPSIILSLGIGFSW